MSELDIVLASYREMFGVKTDHANEIHRLACEEVARLRAAEQSVYTDLAVCTCGSTTRHKLITACSECGLPISPIG